MKKFLIDYVLDRDYLQQVVSSNIARKETSYYLLLSPWDEVSNTFSKRIKEVHSEWNEEEDFSYPTVNMVNLFEVPDAVQLIKSVVVETNPNISTLGLKIQKTPTLIVLHKAFPRMVDYNGSIYAELGL